MNYPQHQHNWLESPPPPSRFRRPWSPDPYDPLPSSSNLQTSQDPSSSVGQWRSERRREPSDVSVEALDLADYAHTITLQNNRYHSHPAFQPYDPYPPSPHSGRPLALARTDSLSPPSLTSASASSSHSQAFEPRSPPSRRPFSLPPPSSFPAASHSSHPSFRPHPDEPHVASPDAEIDISQFPSFTRGWYARERGHGQANPHTFSPPSSAHGHGNTAENTVKRSPFDPAYTFDRDPFSEPYNFDSPPPSYAHGPHSHSARDHGIVPWGAADEEGRPVDPEVKEERMRMLEREFGKNAARRGDEPEHLVGSVDPRGRLITEGPKKRVAVRWIQFLLQLTAAVASIYTALIIKPKTTPPPAKKLPVYLLYVLSFFAILGCTFLFLLYPCCCGRRKPKGAPLTEGPGGMMVLPVQGLPGPGGKKYKGKKGKKGGPHDGGVQVNLIVDPAMFGCDAERGRKSEDEDEDEDGSSAIPGSYSGASSSGAGGGGARRRRPKRRSVFAGLALEEQWKRARKTLKWGVAADVLCAVLWGAEFVVIMLGERCPVGGFLGWCDAYNLATAAACLLVLAHGFSIFFDVKDLSASSVSPRTRT